MDKLREYVKSQAARKVDPNGLRSALLRAGWQQQAVDKVIYEEYFGKKKTKEIIFVVAILVIIVVAALLLFQYINIVSEPVPETNSPVVSNIKGCYSITTSVEKEACYDAKVREGFSCDSLTDEVEKAFCFRALENYLLS